MIPTATQLEALKELINIGVGKGADVLNSMLSSHILLNVPYVRILTTRELILELTQLETVFCSSVDLGFKGDFSGRSQLLFSTEAADKLVAALTGGIPDAEGDLDAIRTGTLCEIGNIVLNGVMGTISNIFHLHFTYSVPNYREGDIRDFIEAQEGSISKTILLAHTRFCVEKLEIYGDIALFFEMGALDALLHMLDNLTQKFLEE
jgi:chemotaxis protein CheC